MPANEVFPLARVIVSKCVPWSPVCLSVCLSACTSKASDTATRPGFLGGADEVNNTCYDYQPAPCGSRLHLLNSPRKKQNGAKHGHCVCVGNPEDENTLCLYQGTLVAVVCLQLSHRATFGCFPSKCLGAPTALPTQ